MANFDWIESDALDGENRYAGVEMRGEEEWQDLWRTLRQIAERVNADPDYQAPWGDAFQTFLDRLSLLSVQSWPAGSPCRVFVSHRQADWPKAERVAYLATQAGLEYWLDIHDPSLAAANRAGLPSPAKEILIAAIIELGLLNSTHVLALHTANSAGSKWIPYELGRAKQRQLFSSRACGWFDPSATTPVAGEYTFLAARTHSDPEVQHWLGNQPGCAQSPRPWKKSGIPNPL